MLDNNKCIVIYNLKSEDLSFLNNEYKIIEVSKEMANMKIRDILDGLKFETVNESTETESLILFNNFGDVEIGNLIKKIRKNIKGGILAMVTENSIEWKLNYLLEHLIEEREWYLSQQKGK